MLRSPLRPFFQSLYLYAIIASEKINKIIKILIKFVFALLIKKNCRTEYHITLPIILSSIKHITISPNILLFHSFFLIQSSLKYSNIQAHADKNHVIFIKKVLWSLILLVNYS